MRWLIVVLLLSGCQTVVVDNSTAPTEGVRPNIDAIEADTILARDELLRQGLVDTNLRIDNLLRRGAVLPARSIRAPMVIVPR